MWQRNTYDNTQNIGLNTAALSSFLKGWERWEGERMEGNQRDYVGKGEDAWVGIG